MGYVAKISEDMDAFLHVEDDYEAGYGAGSTKMQRLQERADIFTFMMWQFGMEGEK